VEERSNILTALFSLVMFLLSQYWPYLALMAGVWMVVASESGMPEREGGRRPIIALAGAVLLSVAIGMIVPRFVG